MKGQRDKGTDMTEGRNGIQGEGERLQSNAVRHPKRREKGRRVRMRDEKPIGSRPNGYAAAQAMMYAHVPLHPGTASVMRVLLLSPGIGTVHA